MPKEKAITDEGLFDDEKAQIKKFFILFREEKIDGLQVLSGIFIIVSKSWETSGAALVFIFSFNFSKSKSAKPLKPEV